MPPRRRQSDKPLSPVLLLARPKTPTRIEAKRLDNVLILLEGPNGMRAVVPDWEVCRLAERLNLEVVGDVSCEKKRGRGEPS